MKITLLLLGNYGAGAYCNLIAGGNIALKGELYMPDVNAKCPTCGATVTVDDAKEATNCPFCQAPFVVEKAVKAYAAPPDPDKKTDEENPDFEIQGGVLISYKGTAKDVIIPDTVKVISNKAFRGCDEMESVVIPVSVVEIEEGRLNTGENVELKDKYVGAFAGCKGLKIVHISGSVKVIGRYAFRNCIQLNSVTTAPGINKISWGVFNNCFSLTNIDLPDTLTEIGNGAFENCTSLTTIDIPESVERIDSGAFRNCTNLINISIKNPQTEIGQDAFRKCPGYKKKKFGCYVASCVYGSYNCPEVWTLRRYRDDCLAKTWYGRAFIHTYYFVSPKVVRLFGKRKWFKRLFRKRLDGMVSRLNSEGYENTPYIDKKW